MIAKYFLHGENEIPIDTARNYFAAGKGERPAKFIQIADKDKLFKSLPKKKIRFNHNHPNVTKTNGGLSAFDTGDGRIVR